MFGKHRVNALLAATVLATVTLGGTLTGCAQGSSSALSASADAFGEPYAQATAAIEERVDDPTLLALRCDITPMGEEPVWTYLFGSRDKSFLYTVETGDEGYLASTYGRLEWADKSWDSVPDPSEVTVSSQEALEAVQAAREGEAPIENYAINLVIYLSGDDTADASTVPMHWEVIVNTTDEDLSGACYTVDARTGAVNQKVVEGSQATEEEQGPHRSSSTNPSKPSRGN